MVLERNNASAKTAGIWLKRIARISSWLLLVCVVILVVSGWGVTQTGVIHKITFGLVDRRVADAIHRATVFPLAFFFLLHVFINIRLSLKSRRNYVKQIVTWALLVFGALILGIVVYMEYFRLGG
jgi:thiosulfate reductase cytochrome b subunit